MCLSTGAKHTAFSARLLPLRHAGTLICLSISTSWHPLVVTLHHYRLKAEKKVCSGLVELEGQDQIKSSSPPFSQNHSFTIAIIE